MVRARSYVRVALALLAGATWACAGAKKTSTGWTMSVDTLPNGALHVVNTPPAGGGSPQWTLREELRIGSETAGSPDLFGQIKDLEVTSDGRMAVLETQAREIRVFAPTGEHLATFGGEGEGPGELEGPLGMMRDAQDRLWVPDATNARMSVFDPTAGFERSFPLHLMTYGWVWDGAMMDDGRIVKRSITLGPPREEILRVWDDSMRLVDSIPMPPLPDFDRKDPPSAFIVRAADGSLRVVIDVPFYPRGQTLIDPRGGVWSTAFGDATYRISHWTSATDTTLIVETRRPSVAVTASERDSAIADLRENYATGGTATELDWSKIPSVKPAVELLFLSDDGELWVRTPTADGGALFDRYDRSGRHVGTVVSNLHLLWWVAPVVRGDTFWAVVTDELDVPYVVRARIVPTGWDGER